MLILLEGADGTGKTTLYNTLIKESFDSFYTIRGDKNLFEKWNTCKEQHKDSIVICDRSFVTDLVYRLQDGLKGDMSLREMSDLLDVDVKIIFCKTDTCFEDSINRGEDNITTKEKSKEIQMLYDYVEKMIKSFTSTKTIDYNWKQDNIEKIQYFINGGKNGI